MVTKAMLNTVRRLHRQASDSRAPQLVVKRSELLDVINAFWSAQQATDVHDARIDAAIGQLQSLRPLRAANPATHRYTGPHEPATSRY